MDFKDLRAPIAVSACDIEPPKANLVVGAEQSREFTGLGKLLVFIRNNSFPKLSKTHFQCIIIHRGSHRLQITRYEMKKMRI